MQADAQKQELTATLEALESLHREENGALRSMASDRLDELTERKLELWQRLRTVTAILPPGPDERASLERIRKAALSNQILLHHARDAVRTILQAASGQALPPPSTLRPSTVQDGLRVDYRG